MAVMLGVITAAALGASAAMAYAVASPSSQVFGPAIVRGRRDRRRVALTFDDGPSESTPAILDALARRGARATFFFCGANAARLPDAARRAAAEGHEIGNHTFTHPRLYKCSPARIDEEVARTQQVLGNIIGRQPNLFRPPYGIRWFGLYPVLRRYDLRNVMWSVCLYDWRRTADQIERTLCDRAAAGDIVLLHDGDTLTPGDRRAATAFAVDRALPLLAQRGLHCVTVSEILDGAPTE